MGETAKLVEKSWKVRFVDAFVCQFRKRRLDYAFSVPVYNFLPP
jgi:hypothetical protein